MYLLIEPDERVVGYFAGAHHLLSRGEAPTRLARGAPEFIPAVLLAKRALDVSLHGRRLGSELLMYALEVIVEAARRVRGRVVIFDAIHDHRL